MNMTLVYVARQAAVRTPAKSLDDVRGLPCHKGFVVSCFYGPVNFRSGSCMIDLQR